MRPPTEPRAFTFTLFASRRPGPSRGRNCRVSRAARVLPRRAPPSAFERRSSLRRLLVGDAGEVSFADGLSATEAAARVPPAAPPGHAPLAVFELDLFPDLFPDEILWTLTDPAGDSVASGIGTQLRRRGGPDGGPAEQYTAFGPIPLVAEGRYTFRIFDRSSDGICCLYGFGRYDVRVDGELIASGDGQYEAEDSVSFVVGPRAGGEPAAAPARADAGGAYGRLAVRVDVREGAADVHWALISPEGVIVSAGHMAGDTEVRLGGCGTYGFIIRDSAGDGIVRGDSYELRLDGRVVARGGGDLLEERREAVEVPCGAAAPAVAPAPAPTAPRARPRARAAGGTSASAARRCGASAAAASAGPRARAACRDL